MTRQDKYKSLFFLACAILLIFLLGISITRMEMKPGQPLPSSNQANGSLDVPAPSGFGEWLLLILRGCMAFVLVLTPIYIIVSLFSPKGRRRLLANIAFFITILLFLSMLREAKPPESSEKPQAEATAVNPLGELANNEPAENAVPKITPGLEKGICFGLVLLISAVVAVFIWVVGKSLAWGAVSPLSRLAKQANVAAQEIQAGGDIRDTVIRCYVQMSQVLYEERGIQRAEAMTPNEFEQVLTKLGLPEAPIHRLTRLFEEVRYGHIRPGWQEEREAVENLKAIAKACKSAG